jgi:hypothetical protein
LYDLLLSTIPEDAGDIVRRATAKEILLHIKKARFALFGTKDALKDLRKFTEGEIRTTLANWHEGEDLYAALRKNIIASICQPHKGS